MSGITQATFPLKGRIPSTDGSYAELQKQLGVEFSAESGKRYRLVQAATADGTGGRNKIYAWAAFGSHTVDLAGAGDPPVGVGLSAQESLAAGDLFWLQIGGRATLTDNGDTTAAGDTLICGATGLSDVASATTLSGDVVGVALEAALASATFTAQLRMS